MTAPVLSGQLLAAGDAPSDNASAIAAWQKVADLASISIHAGRFAERAWRRFGLSPAQREEMACRIYRRQRARYEADPSSYPVPHVSYGRHFGGSVSPTRRSWMECV